MGKLRTLSAQEVRTILEKHGFVLVRQRGSHMILQKRAEGTTTTIPVPNHRELKTGTLASIIRQSGLPKSLFEH